MAFGKLGGKGGFGSLGGTGGASNAAAFAPVQAPVGFHWEFVTFNGQRVTAKTSRSPAEPVVALVRN